MAVAWKMQAKSSTSGLLVTWTSPSGADWTGSLFPGPGSPQDIAGTPLGSDTGGGGGGSNIITGPTWNVDPVNGSDANTGLPGSPVKTWRGLLSKWGTNAILQPTGGTMTVTFLNSQPDRSDPVNLEDLIVADGCAVIIKGTPTTTHTGSFTAVSPINRAANQAWQATDSALATSWTANVGIASRLRVPSGPNAGNVLWVAKDLGSKQARLAAPLAPNDWLYGAGSMGSISVSDPYVVETLTSIYVGECAPYASAVTGASTYPHVTFRDLMIGEGQPGAVMNLDGTCDLNFEGCAVDCSLEAIVANGSSGVNFIDCCLSGDEISSGLLINFWGGLVIGGTAVGSAGFFNGQVYVDADCLFQASVLSVGCLVGGTFGFFDSMSVGVQVSSFALFKHNTIVGSSIYGQGNAQYGVALSAGSNFNCTGSTVPTVTGTSGDFQMNGSTTACAWNPQGNFWTSGINCTWANLAAAISAGGFGGTAHIPDSDCHIVAAASSGGGSDVQPSVAVSALNIDWSKGGVFTKTLAAGASAFTFSNALDGQTIIAVVTGAASTLTWPTVKWAGGTPPTQTASGTDVYTFVKAGTTIYGSVVQAMA